MASRYETPYEGTEQINPFTNLRIGVVTKINNELVWNEAKNYNTVNLNWIDGQIYSENFVPVAKIMSGNGYGIFTMPYPGDIVVAHFRKGSKPIILGFIDKNAYQSAGQQEKDKDKENNDDGKQILNDYGDVKAKDDTTDSFIPMRRLQSGEIYVKSRQQAELFMDANGMLKLIARGDFDATNNIPERVVEVLMGKKLKDEWGNEILDSDGNNLTFQMLQNQTGTKLTLNTDGKFEVNSTNDNIVLNSNGNSLTLNKSGSITLEDSNGTKISLDGNNISIGANATSPIPLGDKLFTFLQQFVLSYNLHTHVATSLGSPTTIPTIVQTAPTSDMLSQTVTTE